MRPTVRVEEIVRKLIALFVIVLVFGCKKAEKVFDLAAVNSAPPPAPSQAQRAALEAPAPKQQPMIVRTASVKIIVEDTSKAVDAVTKSAESQGGYVSGSHVWRDGELLRATLTLRVPSAKLTTMLASIRGIAKRVENETISSEEVTQEYVDLESQLRNLEATEAELRQLMTDIRKNARRASEVMEMHQQITAIHAEIERTKGRMRYLSQVAAMSNVSLEIVPDFIAQPVVEPGWQPVVIVKDASRALVGVLQSVATAAIWVLVYLVPIVGMLLLVTTVLWKVYRRARTRAA